ncbi:MAG: DNA adenine methylase [Malacoplasma sp.]|nr:DNA adenine methylase [Malacoplasma sp.]
MISSPLRYPGGKGKLYNQVKQIILDNNLQDKSYTEPFAGGYGIGIKLLLNGDIEHALINDFDFHIAAIWRCIFFETDDFIKLIKDTPINLQTWRQQKEIYNNTENHSLLDVGFSAFFLNRTNYSGVLKGGPIGGTNQEGKYKIDCRFNKSKLIELIKQIGKLRDKVEIFNLDVNDFIDQVIDGRRDELFVNFDPPYVSKGEVLYRNYFTEDDHRQLAAKIINNLQDVQWIMTYDDCDLIKELYKNYNPVNFNLQYVAGTKRIGEELLISNLH